MENSEIENPDKTNSERMDEFLKFKKKIWEGE